MKKKQITTKEEYHDDVLDLFRKVVGTVSVSDVKNFEGLQEQSRINFLKYCNTVYTEPAFAEIIKSLIWECVQKAAMESRDMDQLLVNRATANGIRLVQDFFQKFSAQYVQEFETEPEDFDKNAAFNPLP